MIIEKIKIDHTVRRIFLVLPVGTLCLSDASVSIPIVGIELIGLNHSVDDLVALLIILVEILKAYDAFLGYRLRKHIARTVLDIHIVAVYILHLKCCYEPGIDIIL